MSLTLRKQQFLLPKGGCGFNSCHASTLTTLPGGDVLVAYFAGEKEGSDDTAIWISRQHQGHWQEPQRAIACDGVAHWNPVLHRDEDELWLFYKVGPGVHEWQTRYVKSRDNGMTWSKPAELVPGDTLPRGPVKNKLLVTADGSWLAPGSTEDDRYWDAFVDRSENHGLNWQMVRVPVEHCDPLKRNDSSLWQGLAAGALWENDPGRVFQWDGVIQPTLWESAPDHIHMLMRSTRGQIYRSDSADNGKSWSMAYATSLPNNNSGIDLACSPQGALVLAYNPVAGNWGRRFPLSLSLSTDNGERWSTPFDVESEEGEFSYPAIICEGNTVHLTYTWNRKNIVYCALSLA
ncbi:sialidase family protein [Klebsiella pneumoniae]|uniref:sialidase family protein n=1 Tax=Klebsiella pneumoniae TaxID=573 RepID=UPI0015E9E0B7|nr:exo-alpha-sialidase [Klebsiella pneumoniae]QLS82872.1 exo-alpha-sialidase [Klebsiella pneumoniae]HBS7612481.1 exo-alpha-sialidase [Klebsiella pneumoniae]